MNPRVAGSHGDMAQALAMAVYELRHVSDPDAQPAVGWIRDDLSSLYAASRLPAFGNVL